MHHVVGLLVTHNFIYIHHAIGEAIELIHQLQAGKRYGGSILLTPVYNHEWETLKQPVSNSLPGEEERREQEIVQKTHKQCILES